LSHRPVCVKCRVEMHPEENGAGCLDLTESGQPYQIYDSDRYKCPVCGIEILTGFGQLPVSARWEDDFDETVAEWRKYHSVIEVKA